MESFIAEKLYNDYSTELAKDSNKIDLTLKLSPYGGGEIPEEERKLQRSSSVVAIGPTNGTKWGPFVAPSSLERSCSLPSEAEKKGLVSYFRDLQGMTSAEIGRKRMLFESHIGDSRHKVGSYNIPYMVQRPWAEGGVDANIQTQTKQENDSLTSKKTTMAADARAEEIPAAKRSKLGNYCSLKGDVMEILRQMPSVTTIGDGPNGKRIEGFLYKYRTGQVCIVCVCHGNFLTPAEFIVHAGGKEVANPMKHITVYTNSF